jgi:hypothetical protein
MHVYSPLSLANTAVGDIVIDASVNDLSNASRNNHTVSDRHGPVS